MRLSTATTMKESKKKKEPDLAERALADEVDDVVVLHREKEEGEMTTARDGERERKERLSCCSRRCARKRNAFLFLFASPSLSNEEREFFFFFEEFARGLCSLARFFFSRTPPLLVDENHKLFFLATSSTPRKLLQPYKNGCRSRFPRCHAPHRGEFRSLKDLRERLGASAGAELKKKKDKEDFAFR